MTPSGKGKSPTSGKGTTPRTAAYQSWATPSLRPQETEEPEEEETAGEQWGQSWWGKGSGDWWGHSSWEEQQQEWVSESWKGDRGKGKAGGSVEGDEGYHRFSQKGDYQGKGFIPWGARNLEELSNLSVWDIYSKLPRGDREEALRYQISPATRWRNDDITEEQLQAAVAVIVGRLPNLSRWDAYTWACQSLETKGQGSDFLRFHKGMGSKGKGKTDTGKGPQDFGKGKGKTDPVKGNLGKGKTTTGKGIGQGQRYQHDDTTPGK